VGVSEADVAPAVDVPLTVIMPAAIAAVIHVFLTVFTRQVLSLERVDKHHRSGKGWRIQPLSGTRAYVGEDLISGMFTQDGRAV
jgi:hypothetical protein